VCVCVCVCVYVLCVLVYTGNTCTGDQACRRVQIFVLSLTHSSGDKKKEEKKKLIRALTRFIINNGSTLSER
jgi:hypothetical protein